MTKDVLLTISGLQFAQDMDAEPIQIVTAGSYYKKNGKHYVVYEEVMEGFEGTTKNLIKMSEDYLDITKKGVANVHMVFEKDKKNVTYYETPYGMLLIGIDAESRRTISMWMSGMIWRQIMSIWQLAESK